MTRPAPLMSGTHRQKLRGVKSKHEAARDAGTRRDRHARCRVPFYSRLHLPGTYGGRGPGKYSRGHRWVSRNPRGSRTTLQFGVRVKAIVFGLLERETGKVRTSVVGTRRKHHLHNQIRENVVGGVTKMLEPKDKAAEEKHITK